MKKPTPIDKARKKALLKYVSYYKPLVFDPFEDQQKELRKRLNLSPTKYEKELNELVNDELLGIETKRSRILFTITPKGRKEVDE